MPDEHAPQVILIGGTDELQLEEGGKIYRPGDVMPRSLSHAKRVSLTAAGLRFETRHHEPVLTPDGQPATISAAEQIEPPPGGPAVIAAVEAGPAALEPPAPQPAHEPRRAARKDAD